jgi:hypothetical protein
MRTGFVRVVPWLLAGGLGGAYDDYLSAKHKLDLIEEGRLGAGARVVLSPRELNAYAERTVPGGVRNARLELVGPGEVTGTVLVDFVKLRRAQGDPPGWLMAKLLDGEYPVSATVRIRSEAGRATVDVERVQIGGVEIDGRTLDFLIQNVLLPLYPAAAVGRPFDLGYRIQKLEVGRSGVTVVIGD